MVTTIKILDNGPMIVIGEVDITDAVGNTFARQTHFSICRCGLSDSKPYCDGSHRPQGFKDASRADTADNDDPV